MTLGDILKERKRNSELAEEKRNKEIELKQLETNKLQHKIVVKYFEDLKVKITKDIKENYNRDLTYHDIKKSLTFIPFPFYEEPVWGEYKYAWDRFVSWALSEGLLASLENYEWTIKGSRTWS